MENLQIQVRTGAGIPVALRDYAREKVESVLRHTSRPVLFARISLVRLPDPAVPRPAQARVEIDLNGAVLLASADAATPTEAIDLMKDRLSARLGRVDAR